MATTTMTTGTGSRKQLATQLDRLDSILDGLADNLAMAVAQAVRQAVSEALQQAAAQAATQALSRPEVLEGIKAAVTAAIPVTPANSTNPTAPNAAAEPTLTAVARRWGLTLRKKSAAVRDGSRAWLGSAWGGRKRLLGVAGIGLGVTLTAFLAGPLLSAAVVGLVGVAVAWLATGGEQLKA